MQAGSCSSAFVAQVNALPINFRQAILFYGENQNGRKQINHIVVFEMLYKDKHNLIFKVLILYLYNFLPQDYIAMIVNLTFKSYYYKQKC